MQSSMTTWDCRQAKAEIALQAGEDAVSPATSTLLETHLAECAACREYLAELSLSLESLRTCAAQSLASTSRASLWPGLAARLPVTQPHSSVARFNVWVPTAMMTAACAAMILVTIVQFERVAPFQPQLTPRVRAVMGHDIRNEFRTPEFIEHRRSNGRDRTSPGQMPVRYRESIRTGDF
jgi:hypothetical protein